MRLKLWIMVGFLLGVSTMAAAQTPCRQIEFYGGINDGVSDNTPALIAAQAAGDRSLCFGSGYYRFATKPPAFTYTISLIGESVSQTALIKAWDSSAYNDALIEIRGSNANGSRVERMSIVANDSHGGTLLLLKSTLGSPVSYITLRDLNFTYGPNADYDLAIFVDGLDANTAAQGARTILLDNISAFSGPGKWWALEFDNVVNLRVANLWTNGSIKLSGWYTYYTTNISVTMTNVIVGDAIYMESATGISIQGQCYRLYAQPTAVNGGFQGFAYAVYNNSPNFRVY